MDRGIQLAKQYHVDAFIQPIVDFAPQLNSPPLAPKHVVQQPVAKPKKKGPTADHSSMATRSAKRVAPGVAAANTPSDDIMGDSDEDAIGEDEEVSDVEIRPPALSLQGSEDDSMTSSPSEGSSSSRTPPPYGSRGPSSASGSMIEGMEWTTGDPYGSKTVDPAGPRHQRRRTNGDPAFTYTQPTDYQITPSQYGDIILEYFISDSTTIPSILVSPPPDFDPDMPIDDDGHTALHWACAMGRVRVVKLLLTANADVFKTNKAGQTALMRSVMFANNYDVRKFHELYELLHRSTLNIDHSNRTVFHHIVDLAMTKGKTHAARYYMETLLNRLADFPQELADIINFQDEDGETALTLAARCRSKRLVKLLLDHGADPKIKNYDNKSTEDYILEDERFRHSPTMRGQALPFVTSASTSNNKLPGAYGPRLYLSQAARNASGKATQQLTVMLDNLANAFDQEFADKERDLTQANALLANLQTETVDTQKAVAALQQQTAILESERERLRFLEAELAAKMDRRFRLSWEKWVKEEESKEKVWRAAGGGSALLDGAAMSALLSPERKTRATGSVQGEDAQVLEDLHSFALQKVAEGPEAVAAAVSELQGDIAKQRARRIEDSAEFVRLGAEAGTGGRMSEYRRLIGAGCGGVPPNEVDAVIGVLLEVSDFIYLFPLSSDNCAVEDPGG